MMAAANCLSVDSVIVLYFYQSFGTEVHEVTVITKVCKVIYLRFEAIYLARCKQLLSKGFQLVHLKNKYI